MTDKKDSSIKNFIAKKVKSIHENGLVAAISVFDPLLRNEKAFIQTRNDIDAAILFPAIGTGLATGIAISTKLFPVDEANKIARLFINLDANSTPRFLIDIATTGIGFAIGGKITLETEKLLKKAMARNEERKKELKELNPERFLKLDAKTEIMAEKHITRNARIKQKYDEITDKIYEKRESVYKKVGKISDARYDKKIDKLQAKKRKSKDR